MVMFRCQVSGGGDSHVVAVSFSRGREPTERVLQALQAEIWTCPILMSGENWRDNCMDSMMLPGIFVW